MRLNEIFENEFNKMKKTVGIKHEFVLQNENEFKKIFSYIFIINYFKNRIETKGYFEDKFNMTFSLLLESTFAVFSGQCRGALLLLRSAQEANYKFVLEREREEILRNNNAVTFGELDYRFIETKRHFLNDLTPYLDRSKFVLYYQSIERNMTLYRELSGIVHSGTQNQPIMNVAYFSNLYKETVVDKLRFFELFISVLNEVFTLNFFLLRKSLKNWDYYLLYDLLRISIGDKKTKTFIRTIKAAN